MTEIRFPEYRSYTSSRVEVNDAMTALLVGSRLAAHTLSLTAGSSATLGELFPAVQHINRYNMKSDVAREFLSNADHHIASVAVPYALATHEDFVTDMIDILRGEGTALVTHGKSIRAWNMHTVLFESCGESISGEWIESFHVLREMRNCITHSGGEVSQGLRKAIAQMGQDSRDGWARINSGKLPEDMEDTSGRLVLTSEHIFAAFAVTKRLGRDINALLGRSLSREKWAKIAVKDYASNTSKTKNSSSWRRSLLGYCERDYHPVCLTESELEQAARTLGLWTVTCWR